MVEVNRIAENVHMISGVHPVPGHGILAINSLVIKGSEPILVETGAPSYRQDYLNAVFALVEPKDIKWIFLSHEDPDHSGNLWQILDNCPNAKLLTNFLSVGKLTYGGGET